MSRQRIEDLGRLMVMLDYLLEHDLFDKLFPSNERPKDFIEFKWDVLKKDPEKAEEFLEDIVYAVHSVREKLYECLEVAKGWDTLNDPI